MFEVIIEKVDGSAIGMFSSKSKSSCESMVKVYERINKNNETVRRIFVREVL